MDFNYVTIRAGLIGSSEDLIRLRDLLKDGYEIISSAGTPTFVHYVLTEEPEELKEGQDE